MRWLVRTMNSCDCGRDDELQSAFGVCLRRFAFAAPGGDDPRFGSTVTCYFSCRSA
jgi:hypothetical protein